MNKIFLQDMQSAVFESAIFSRKEHTFVHSRSTAYSRCTASGIMHYQDRILSIYLSFDWGELYNSHSNVKNNAMLYDLCVDLPILFMFGKYS